MHTIRGWLDRHGLWGTHTWTIVRWCTIALYGECSQECNLSSTRCGALLAFVCVHQAWLELEPHWQQHAGGQHWFAARPAPLSPSRVAAAPAQFVLVLSACSTQEVNLAMVLKQKGELQASQQGCVPVLHAHDSLLAACAHTT